MAELPLTSESQIFIGSSVFSSDDDNTVITLDLAVILPTVIRVHYPVQSRFFPARSGLDMIIYLEIVSGISKVGDLARTICLFFTR